MTRSARMLLLDLTMLVDRFRSCSFSFAFALTIPACYPGEGDSTDAESASVALETPRLVAVAGDVVQISLPVDDPSATVVTFAADGVDFDTCDTAAGPDECRRGDLVRTAAIFQEVGLHTVTLIASGVSGDTLATIAIDVRSRREVRAAGAADFAAVPSDRGFLDPDRPPHRIFGGVKWSVSGQKVIVAAPPAGSIEAVAECMRTYGASIERHADANGISRASVAATAITESNCTNPSGSSDGLSSGPMQVTGRTCALFAPNLSARECKSKMHADPHFSFAIGAKYMGSDELVSKHHHDPPKIAAAYNAGSVRRSTRNRWHMLVTGNHLERFVAAYNAYRAWEDTAAADGDAGGPARSRTFEGRYVPRLEDLPAWAPDGTVYFVGDWPSRDGAFVERRAGAWQAS